MLWLQGCSSGTGLSGLEGTDWAPGHPGNRAGSGRGAGETPTGSGGSCPSGETRSQRGFASWGTPSRPRRGNASPVAIRRGGGGSEEAGAVCGTRGSLGTMHGGGSAPSCCAFTHRVAFEEGPLSRLWLGFRVEMGVRERARAIGCPGQLWQVCTRAVQSRGHVGDPGL